MRAHTLLPSDLQIMRNVLLFSKYHCTYSAQSFLTDHMPSTDVWYLGGEGKEHMWRSSLHGWHAKESCGTRFPHHFWPASLCDLLILRTHGGLHSFSLVKRKCVNKNKPFSVWAFVANKKQNGKGWLLYNSVQMWFWKHEVAKFTSEKVEERRDVMGADSALSP